MSDLKKARPIAKLKRTATKTALSEIRRHYFLDRYVIIAPKRGLRPDTMSTSLSSHNTETATSPAIEADRSVFEVANPDGGWFVKVINNKYPALTLNNARAYGKQEVVIETPEHNREFSDLSLKQIERVFTAYIARAKALNRIKGIRYVSVFKNDGPAAGASIAHAHSQIIALPVIPPLIETESIAQQVYIDDENSCPYCDIITWEEEQKVRIIFEDEHIVALAPYASQNAFEAWILPRRHKASFAKLSAAERNSTAIVLKKISTFLDALGVSFNFFLQDSLAPYNHHFVLRVEPRRTVWAGLELSTGVIVNPVAPEQAAKWYKKAHKAL